MATSREVFAKRKEGALEEAYKMALELIQNPGKDDWDVKAFGWCVIDLIKRDAKSGDQQKLGRYAQQLKELEVDPSDNVLTDQKRYALKLCNPSGQDILRAKALSKEGENQESLNLYRKILSSGDQSTEVRTGLAWEQYRVAKSFVDQDPPNFNGAKKHLNDYFQLETDKPSLLHTCFLQLADKIAIEGKLNMGAFARIWNLEYLRPEDYELYRPGDGEVYPSLAEKVVQHASKDAFLREAEDDLNYILPFINDCIDRYPENLWLKLSKAKALMGTGRNEEALSFGLEVVKNKVNDFWAWELLGDIHLPVSAEIALSCYCKALLCSRDINFVGKVKIKLAELLVKRKSYSHAKFEIDEIVNYRISNNQKIPKAADLLKRQPWYEDETAAVFNKALYLKNVPLAEELLFSELPWINGFLGDKFTIDANPKKPGRKVFIQSAPVPMEITIPESKVSISEKHSGMGIRVKGENDDKGRFQLFSLEERNITEKWDIFEELIGVVDHVNQEKKLLHFMINQNIDGIIKFSDLSDRFDEGDAIAVRVSKYISRQGVGYRAVTSRRTEEKIPESLVKPFEDRVREKSGMGFTDSGIFIPPPIVREYGIKNGDSVSGLAVVNYNKKRSEWGWKAISINNVASTYNF